MKVTVIRPQDLSAEETKLWQAFQDQNPDYRSPYFSPQFTLAVGTIRQDARVAICEDDSGIQAFLPFHQREFGIGKPIGGPLSDYHGLIARTGFEYDARDLILRSGLKVFDFSHLLPSQRAFIPYARRTIESRYLDLSGGYDNYLEKRRMAGTSQVSSVLRRLRNLERDVAPIRFVPRDMNEKAFELLLRWKNGQYKRTRAPVIFEWPWTVDLLRKLLYCQDEHFGGRLSTLYLNDQPIAVHMGLVSKWSWHYWFPAFDRNIGRYSPGLILLLKLAEYAAGSDFEELDLGHGNEPYKKAFASHERNIITGTIALPGVALSSRRLRRGVEAFCAVLPVSRPSEWTRRFFRHLDAYNAFRY